MASETFLDGARFTLPSATESSGFFYPSELTNRTNATIKSVQESSSQVENENWEWMSFQECMRRYNNLDTPMVYYRHVIMVMSNQNNTPSFKWTRHNIFKKPWGAGNGNTTNSLWSLQDHIRLRGITADLENYKSERSTNMTLDPTTGVLGMTTEYKPAFETMKIDYCLSESFQAPCRLSIANPLLLIVCIMCILKCLLCSYTFKAKPWGDEDPLMTVGDGIASFVAKPDAGTKGMFSFSIGADNDSEYAAAVAVEFEWASYGITFKALRVTKPRGQQRSTYRLQLPCRWSIPLLATSSILHWVYSNCFYLSNYEFYDSKIPYEIFEIDRGLQFSTVAILIAFSLSLLIALIPIILARFNLSSDMVLAGSNSKVISAACHCVPIRLTDATSKADTIAIQPLDPVEIGGSPLDVMATVKLRWGDVSTENSDGHLAFGVLNQEVTDPIQGRYYGGRRRRRTENVETVQQQIQVHSNETQELDLSPSQSPEPIQQRWDHILRRPPVERNIVPDSPEPTFTLSLGPSVSITELLDLLPPTSVTEYLVARYFGTLSSLFHILHGPTFQTQYLDFLEAPEKTSLSWLALLFAIVSLTLKTIEPSDAGLVVLWQDTTIPRDLSLLSQKYRNAAMTALSQDQFLVRHDLSTLEALLILVHMISHNEGPEYGWALLGSALNIAIALRCHTDTQESNYILRERRRRCWAGILILHTYQALCFRDIDLTFLLNMKATMPAWVNDKDIQEHSITAAPADSPCQFTDTSLIKFQVRLFQLGTEICSHISSDDKLNETLLHQYDAAVAKEQKQWDTAYLVNGRRSILNTSGYAHWCMLQTYAHQLYLLLHRPFHSSRSNHFRAESRDKCIKSGLALLDVHHQFYELPRLKCYRWLVKGAISCNALHGAVALTSCMLDMPGDSDLTEHISAIDAAINRMEALKMKSPACSSVYRVLRCVRSYLSKRDPAPIVMPEDVELRFEDWATNVDWFRPDGIDWECWDWGDSVYITPPDDPQSMVA
ncbi:hypothetical protein F53441_1520 [Fusarium austroafricanum]|uniref:Xylanolytic transcriptional activator regulatory domain-containing protein n=1 Tax=Fusarium austroafricanum TaxID=2364996 RepID=A0A8H4P500_9HYPO|nr:hypothetical protein F53441_1520 [Fusarium austroafricanum]